MFFLPMQTCKNIVLAGIGSLTLIDDSPMTLEASAANFLIHFDEFEGQGITIAEACAASLRDYNPMVRVSAEPGRQFLDYQCYLPIVSLLYL